MHVNQHSVGKVFHWLSNESPSQLTNFLFHRHNTSKWAKLQNLHTLTYHTVSWKAKVYVSLRVYWPLGCTGNLLHTSLRYLGSGLCFGKHTQSWNCKWLKILAACCKHANTCGSVRSNNKTEFYGLPYFMYAHVYWWRTLLRSREVNSKFHRLDQLHAVYYIYLTSILGLSRF